MLTPLAIQNRQPDLPFQLSHVLFAQTLLAGIVGARGILGEGLHQRVGVAFGLLEAVTYRDHGHFEGDEQKYKALEGEEKDWADVDALDVFRDYAIEHGLLTEEELDAILDESRKDVEEAIKFARSEERR